jgi:hypothetical protein
MNYVEIGLLSVIALCALAALIGPVCNVLEDKFVYKDDGYGRARMRFMDEARAQGFSCREAMNQLFLREALARFRREASDAVRADSTHWIDRLAEAKAAALDFVAATRPALLPPFVRALNDLTYHHILYPNEVRMIERQIVLDWGSRPDEDQVAALRIVRPS